MTQPAADIFDVRHGGTHVFTSGASGTEVYGIKGDRPIRMTGPGTAFGYVGRGSITFSADGRVYVADQGEYFCMPVQSRLTVLGRKMSVGFYAWQRPYIGLRMIGGPVEERGRLKYIDGCSDTLLIAPPLKGDPCFNLLHFPPGITQTKHTHPSVRVGLIHGGRGKCITAHGEHPLLPGNMFVLAPDAVHAFVTEGEGMDLTVYHPDSDFGPTHEEHPMLNRTIVDGVSAKDLPKIQTKEIT